MLKTLDILIGATTVLLLFSMAVTVITQAVTSLLDKRGKHLLAGLASLLQHLGIQTRDTAETIAKAVLTHPMVAAAEGKPGTVVSREEFTLLLLDLASGQGAASLEGDALSELQNLLKKNGVADPGQTLNNIRKMALMLETSNPELANHFRSELSIVRECATDYVVKVNAWFDQTIDRVSQAFTRHAHRVTIAAAFVVVIAIQLDIIAVVDRLSIDDQFRNAVVGPVAKQFTDSVVSPSTNTPPAPTATPPAPNSATSAAGAAATPATSTATLPDAGGQSPTASPAGPQPKPQLDTQLYYNLLDTAGLITLPTNKQWLDRIKDPRKYPGMIIAALLISLGAPFWYNILKDLLGLRSTLAQKDDAQRAQRQAPQPASNPSLTSDSGPLPSDPLQGEQGDLQAVG
ncbi:MAG TPA: hypothetical protein VEG68_19105 [Terriglobales bacterium]|nr:hypothetical protein [Terriglobales bacterium]